MIEFKRDKDGNLYAVKDGEVVSAVVSMGDVATDQEVQNGNQSGQNRKSH